MNTKMNKTLSLLSLLGLGLGCVMDMQAQTTANRSPYSRYAYGTAQELTVAGNRALGGLAVGLRDAMITNPGNPASYTSVDSMTFVFDLGLSARYTFLFEGKEHDKRLLGNLDYITMLYPLGKRLAMSAGIIPLFTRGYNFGGQVPIQGAEQSETYIRSYSGQGSYNQLYVGLAGRALQDLHLGLNAGFVFGHMSYQTRSIHTQPNAQRRVHSENLHLRGLKLDFGAQYQWHLDSTQGRSLVLGAVLTPAYALSNELSESIDSSDEPRPQEHKQSLRKGYTMPMQLGLGLSLRKDEHYMYGVDLRYGRWSKAKFYNNQAKFQDTWRLALGAEWTPNARARNLWQRTKYRVGIWGATSYLQIPQSEELRATSSSPGRAYSPYYEYGLSLGLALPLVDRRSELSLSLDYKHLTPKSPSMVSEQYFGATLGITFNEGWFRRAKVN